MGDVGELAHSCMWVAVYTGTTTAAGNLSNPAEIPPHVLQSRDSISWNLSLAALTCTQNDVRALLLFAESK